MSGLRRDGAIARFAAVFTVVVILLGAGASEASGVVGGKAVSITAAPWTVLVQEYGYPICTGVIIDSSQILTAGHCVTSDNGESAEPSPASDFTVEAGISNHKQPLKSDHQQSRSVSAVRVMPGYVAASKLTSANYLDTVDHDLAVLTLSEPLDLDGDDARVAYLPSASTPMPGRVSRLVLAGFGNEKPSTYAKSAGDWTGQLNEVVNSSVRRSCGTSHVLCVFEQTSAACWGDSGSGAVEPGSRSIVVGIFSEGESPCRPGENYYAFLASRAALRFVHASMRSSYIDGISDGSADAHTVIRPLPAIGIVCVILGALGVLRIRQRHERSRR